MAVDMSGEERVAAPIEEVWAALNDPETLKACIPGCETLERGDDDTLSAVVSLKIGPIKARFNGAVALSNIDPPCGYTISGEGKGGIAGFAKGGADVSLTEAGSEATILAYTARAEVGGKIAQLGSRLIQSTSKKLAAEFFSRLNQRISRG